MSDCSSKLGKGTGTGTGTGIGTGSGEECVRGKWEWECQRDWDWYWDRVWLWVSGFRETPGGTRDSGLALTSTPAAMPELVGLCCVSWSCFAFFP